MNFPGGPVTIPGQLLLSGKSEPTQIQAPEQVEPIVRMSDEALMEFAESMIMLLESETRDNITHNPALCDYIELLSLQCEREIMRRAF